MLGLPHHDLDSSSKSRRVARSEVLRRAWLQGPRPSEYLRACHPEAYVSTRGRGYFSGVLAVTCCSSFSSTPVSLSPRRTSSLTSVPGGERSMRSRNAFTLATCSPST